jgi:hypothetical protein
MLQGPLRQHPLLLLLLIASSPYSSSDSWLFLLGKDSRNAAGLMRALPTVCFSSGFFIHVELFESWICLGFAEQKTDSREETKKQRETDCKWHLEQLTDVCKIASAYRLRCST